METLITRLRGASTSRSNPVLGPDSSVDNYYVGRYRNLLEEVGYTLTTQERIAINTFVEDGLSRGWINYVKLFLPFIGDVDHSAAGRCALIDNVGNYNKPASTQSGAFTYSGEDKIVAYKNDSGYRIYLNIPASAMRGGISFIATGAFTNVSAGLCGYNWGTDSMASLRSLRETNKTYPSFVYSDAPDNTSPSLKYTISKFVAGADANLGLAIWPDENLASGYRYTNRIYITQDGSKVDLTLRSARACTLTLPPSDAWNFQIGLYTTAGNAKQKIKSFAVVDPEMPAEMIMAYSNAVFALNTALGRDELV